MKNLNTVISIIALTLTCQLNCISQKITDTIEDQCEISDLLAIKNGIIKIHEVSESDHNVIEKRVDDLKELIVRCNSEQSFPKEISLFKNLEKLTLGGGDFGKLPQEIGSLIKLKTLWLIDTNLESLPLEFYHLPQLKHLEIMYSANQFKLQEDLCKSNLGLEIGYTSSKMDIPNCLENQKKIKLINREAY